MDVAHNDVRTVDGLCDSAAIADRTSFKASTDGRDNKLERPTEKPSRRASLIAGPPIRSPDEPHTGP